jgi:hypothetical protein
LPVVGLQGEGGNPLPGMSTRHAAVAKGLAFGELMLQQRTVVPAPQTARPLAVPENGEGERNLGAERATATNSSDAGPAVKTQEPKPINLSSPAEEPSAPNNEESSEGSRDATEGPRAPASAPASVAAKAATGPQTQARRSTAQHAMTKKVTNVAGTTATAPQEATTRSEAPAKPISAADAQTIASRAGSIEGRSDAIAATAPGPNASMAAPVVHPAGKTIEAPTRGTGSALNASGATEAVPVSPRSDRSPAAPKAEGISKDGNLTSVPIAGPAPTGRTLQRIPVETPHSAPSKAVLPANAATNPATAIAQPATTGTPGVDNATGAIAHVFRGGPAGSAIVPASNREPIPISAAFTRMDSAVPLQLLESAPQRLSVGVRDGGLGWVEIRTRAAAGQVSAVLATGSSEAHSTLQAQMPELRNYLAGQQVRVDQLATERFLTSSGSRDPAPQQDGRNGPSRDSDAPREGTPMTAAPGEVVEEGLSYIDVRV